MVCMLAAGVFAPANAGEKIALVIGNSEYRHVEKLTNPANDAADMAASLQRLDFNVRQANDLDYDGFRRVLIEFSNTARTADKAVIFYAGHGVEIDGKNWLIPVDAKIKSAVDVYAEGINLETLIDISIMPKIIGLVILDACRNDPFAATNAAAARPLSKASSPDASKSATKKRDANPAIRYTRDGIAIASSAAGPASRGLAPVEIYGNLLVAFAAAAGTTASDGDGRNSPYSSSLVRHVEKPKLEINYLFRQVHDDVLNETKTQRPTVYGTLPSHEIYLNATDSNVVANAASDSDAERLSWSFLHTTGDIATLRHFVAQFPSGQHAPEARNRIAQLESAERFAWTIVEKENSLAAYRAFLDLYPYGDRAETARVTLASLEAKSASRKDTGPITLPQPPAVDSQAASRLADTTLDNPATIDKAWDVLKESRDTNVTRRFAEKHPDPRRHRPPANSDHELRRINPTEWMMRTALDNDVNRCFAGDAESCATAAKRYPNYAQLQFQLCRTEGNPPRCMQNAVKEARRKGYLVSAYTRSEVEKARNREYRRTVAHVQQNVGNIVGRTVSNVVGNAVSNSVSNAVSAATSQAAGAAATRAASQAAGAAASQAARRAASRAANTAAAASASNAARNAASNAAARAAANAASNIRVPSDISLKEEIVPLDAKHLGLRLYRFRYIGDETLYVGVMAQDVAKMLPDAVSVGDNGFLQVDYESLGLDILTYRDWLRRTIHTFR